MNTTMEQTDCFLVEIGGTKPIAKIALGIQSLADELHTYLCACGGPRWIDCKIEFTKDQITSFIAFTTAHPEPFPYHWRNSSKDGYFSIRRITEPLPGGIFQQKPDPRPALQFTVPLLPPSVNHYKLPNKGGGYRVSADARAYIDAVAIFARAAAPMTWPWALIDKQPTRFYEVDLTFYIADGNYLRGDSDNLEKVAFDALTQCGAIRDDRYIKFHTNRAVPVKTKQGERTEYTIRIVERPALRRAAGRVRGPQ